MFSSDEKPIICDRFTLYEEVWIEPVSVVSRRYGISDVGLAKVCKRLKVPLPPRGYWAKLRSGQKMKRPRLPRFEGESRTKISPTPPRVDDPMEQDAELIGLLERELLPEYQIVVPELLERPEALVRKARASLREKHRKNHGPPPEADESLRLNIDVSQGVADRALRIMNTLLLAFQRREWTFVGDEPRGGKPGGVVILGETIHFRIREKLKMVKVKRDESRHSSSLDALLFLGRETRTEWHPAGRLALIIEAPTYHFGRYECEDKPTRAIEIRLNEFCQALIERAFKRRQHRREEEIARREAEARRKLEELEAKRQLVLQELQRNEARRRMSLFKESYRWSRSLQLARYIDELESELGTSTQDSEHAKSCDEWIAWARRVVDEENPLPSRLKTLKSEKKENA